MSTFELVSSIKDSLSKRGVLNSIRAQLKAGILEAINDENVPLSFKSNERAAAFLGDKAGRVSLDVVKELLESLELKHTLSALHAELGIASSAVDREGLAKELHAPLDYSSKEPLLLHLVQTSRSSSSLSSPKVRATSPKAVGASPASPTVVAPLPLDREPVAVAASKTLSQRRAISLSVSPDKSSSPPSSKSPALSPVAQSEFGGSNKPRSPSSLPSPVGSSDSRSRAGILNPLPQVTLASSSKQLVAAPTAGGGKLGQVLALAKGGKLLNLSDNGPLQSAEVQQISQFLASQTQLESLHLGNCGITDDAFTQLFESIRRLAKLKEINLANNALTTVDPHLFLLPSLKSCVLDGNRLPPVLSEATFAELRMYGKQKTQLSAASISSQDGPEESDDHDISSSFEIDSPEKQPGMQKARSPLSSLSRVVEVHSKTSADKVEINNSTVQRDSRGSVARSKSGWGSSGSARGGDERDTTDDDDFVFAEDGNKAGGASGGESSSSGARRLINPLNNRATSRPRGTSARQSPGGDDLLEQSIGSNQEESDILQRSYVSNQEEEIETLPSIAQNVKSVAAKSKAAVEYADEYGEDDFEDIEEDFSVQDESSDDSGAKFDESSELSPNLQGNRGASALSRTKSGFINTVKGKSQGGEIAQHSEDEADEEAHEDSSPTMDKMKGRGRVLQALASESSSKASSGAGAGWAKTSASSSSSTALLTRKQPKFGGMTAADLEDQSVASEEIDALEFSVGNADSDSNASFSFVHNDDSVLSSHRTGAQQIKVLGGTAEKFSANSSTGSVGGKSSRANASSESVEVDFSETELSTSGQGLYDYDYTTSALPPVRGRPLR